MPITIKKVAHYRLRKPIKQKIESCGYRVDDKNASWFVAFDGKEWLGFGGFWTLIHPFAYVGPTFVQEDYRGRGIQQLLIKRRLKYASSLRIEKIWSRTDFENLTSARNLIRCGFNLDKPQKTGMIENGNWSVTLDGSEILSVAPNELFFSIYL